MPLQHASYLPFWQLQSPAADVTAPLHAQTFWDPAGLQLTSTLIHNSAECCQLHIRSMQHTTLMLPQPSYFSCSVGGSLAAACYLMCKE